MSGIAATAAPLYEDAPAGHGVIGTRYLARAGTPRAKAKPRLSSDDAHHGEESSGDLVRAAARSEALAWHKLVRRFGGLVGGIARAHGLNEADAADVSQMVWLRLVDHLDQLREPDRVAGWLSTTARNESLQLLRRRDRSIAPTPDTSVLDRVDEVADPDVVIATAERNDVLSQLIETLPGHYRRLLRALMVEPVPSYKEISLALGIPVGSIGPTRQRCLALLRRKCILAGIGPEDMARGVASCA